MATAVDNFASWLGCKLQSLNTDEGVFGSYIAGILDGDETVEEKTEALQSILSEIIENDISAVCQEIIETWKKYQPAEEPPDPLRGEDVEVRLSRLLESQSLATTVQKEYTEEEKKIREAILAQYGQLSDEEEAPSKDGAAEAKASGIGKNLNAQSVQQAEKEKREQAKLESQRKKEKDKEDRERQKQLREEKKEKRKTQKGERRR